MSESGQENIETKSKVEVNLPENEGSYIMVHLSEKPGSYPEAVLFGNMTKAETHPIAQRLTHSQLIVDHLKKHGKVVSLDEAQRMKVRNAGSVKVVKRTVPLAQHNGSGPDKKITEYNLFGMSNILEARKEDDGVGGPIANLLSVEEAKLKLDDRTLTVLREQFKGDDTKIFVSLETPTNTAAAA